MWYSKLTRINRSLSAVLLTLIANPAISATWWVATDGNDAASGTAGAPLRTIQSAIEMANAGDIINVRTGIYRESLEIKKQSSATSLLALQAAPGEQPILDGSTLKNPIAIELRDQHFVTISGFEIRNYAASGVWEQAAGIYVIGASSNISIVNNQIHRISSNHATSPIANGIGVYGTSAEPTTNILIEGNSLHDLTLGWSESLVLNGNVDGFSVLNNTVFDNDNIGIDIIGFEQWIIDEGVAVELNRARNGVIRGNYIYNIDSKDNPVYEGARAAGGIYIDGGHNVRIERNVVHNSNIGVELASESPIGSTANIEMLDNEISGSHLAGIALGGYRADLGKSTEINIHHNTLYNNATDPANRLGEIWLQHHVTNTTMHHNIVHAASGDVLINDLNNQLETNSQTDNLFFADSNSAHLKTAAGQTALPMTNPGFHYADRFDLRLQAGSAAETDSKATHGTRVNDLQDRSRVALVLPMVLPHNTWQMFSVPADAPLLQSTIGSVIGDDIPGSYGETENDGWALYRYDAHSGKYMTPKLDATMQTSEAYWIIQMSGDNVSLSMPAESRPPPRTQSTACPDRNGCFEYPLDGSETGDQWVMLGQPLNSTTEFGELRVTATMGPCLVASGCTLPQATISPGANLLSSEFWWFDGSRYISTVLALEPWHGYWALVLPDAVDAQAKLLISR